ncbi:hypothetical protein HID58_053823 [Brassica napus]|uniref:Uncharacterized protein n=2 Tax=Brassica napus TaxID=3708 RepID=A0ABQ8AFS0_BRANA|nr:hypothetical protein HID58_053823 [Brassica napus]
MSSSTLPPLLLFFTVLFLSAVADHHDKTRSRFRPPHFSSSSSSPSQNATSPTRYFEVKKPPVPDSPSTQQPCSHQFLHHDFAYTYSKPPVLANYTLPSHCPSQQFSKIVLELRSTCRGRQFDRIFGVWLDGAELLRSCTAEPTRNGIVWSVEKDVTKYHSLLVKNQTQTLALYLGNIVDKTYTGVYHVDVIFHYYPLDSSHISPPPADMIVPISRSLPLNDGLWFEILSSGDAKRKEIKIPRNVYRAVLEVYVSFHENDEFWYGNLPNDFITANNLSTAGGNGPFREVVVTLDGKVAGAVWPFPVVFTGGINPLLWRPVTAIGSFDLPSYDIEMTPFLGSLLDGEGHEFGFSVTNALNVWFVDANLHLWLDREKEVVEGEVLEVSRSSLEVSSVLDFKGLNGEFKTEAKRLVSLKGLVKSSHGEIVTTSHQEFRYVNKMVLGKDGSLQIIDQLIEGEDRVQSKRGSRPIYAAKSIKSFPFYLYSDSLEQENNTSLEVANVTMGFNEERSESDNGMMRTFKSKVENKQEGQGVMVVKNNLVVNGYGGTQQVYSYVGSDQCYFRNISSFNYDILYDKVEAVCEKNTLKMPEHLAGLETLTSLLLRCLGQTLISISLRDKETTDQTAAQGTEAIRQHSNLIFELVERSETTDLIVEISLQPCHAFRPDDVIIFSDILTPLPDFGVPFDIEEVKGPVIQSPIRTQEDLKRLHPIDLEKLRFVGDSLEILRREVGEHAAVLGFVGAPWTSAGPKAHILNLGHGVLVGTPEEAVAHFFETARSLDYQTLFPNHVAA